MKYILNDEGKLNVATNHYYPFGMRMAGGMENLEKDTATLTTAGIGTPATAPIAGVALQVAATGTVITAGGIVLQANATINATARYNHEKS